MSDGSRSALDLSQPLARFLSEEPEAWSFRRLWRRIPLPLRQEAVEAVLRAGENPKLEGDIRHALAAAGGFRRETVEKMAPQEAARLIGRVPSRRVPSPDVILRGFLTRTRRPLLAAYLDRLGVPNDDGILEGTQEEPVEPEAARAAAATVLERFPTDEVVVYLATLCMVNPELSTGVGDWLQDAVEDRRTTDGTAPVQQEDDAQGSAEEDQDPDSREPELVREARRAVRDEGFVPGTPFTPLDRTLIRSAVDSAQGVVGAPGPSMVEDMVEELLALNSSRHSSFFHRGFVDALTHGSYRNELPAENASRRSWYLAGWLSGLGRLDRSEDIVAVLDDGRHAEDLTRPHEPWAALILPLLFHALVRVGREPEAARLVPPEYLLHNPTLLPDLLREGTRLLRADDAERARPLFDRLGEVVAKLEAEGEPVTEGFFLELRRRRAHCYRQLGEADRARELLERLLDEESDLDIRAMVLADLGLLDAGFRSLADVRLWRSEAEGKDLLEALGRGRARFHQAVATGSRFASHGAWPLAVLAMGSDEWEEARELLSQAITRFLERPDRYSDGRLIPRVKVAAGIAEAMVMDYTRLSRARDLLVAGVAEEARIPSPFLANVLAALEAHEDDLAGEVLTRVLEREGAGILDELGSSETVQRTPAVAAHLLTHAENPEVRADSRARALRRALPILLSDHPPQREPARRALDQLEELAREGIGAEAFLEILSDPAQVDPAWSRDDAAWARVTILESEGSYEEAVAALRERLAEILASHGWHAEEEAEAVLARARSYGLDREWYQDMEARFEAWREEFGERDEPTLPTAHPNQPHRILIVGGDERQNELQERVTTHLAERGDHIRITHLPTGWSGNWAKTLEDAVSAARRHDAVVLLRYMRTEFGRSLRASLDCPWVSCPGVGTLQVARMARRAAVFAAGAGAGPGLPGPGRGERS